jgi:hypothetical protein
MRITNVNLIGDDIRNMFNAYKDIGLVVKKGKTITWSVSR